MLRGLGLLVGKSLKARVESLSGHFVAEGSTGRIGALVSDVKEGKSSGLFCLFVI